MINLLISLPAVTVEGHEFKVICRGKC